MSLLHLQASNFIKGNSKFYLTQVFALARYVVPLVEHHPNQAPKGHRLDSWSGHIPGLPANPPGRGVQEAANPFLSLSLSLSSMKTYFNSSFQQVFSNSLGKSGCVFLKFPLATSHLNSSYCTWIDWPSFAPFNTTPRSARVTVYSEMSL